VKQLATSIVIVFIAGGIFGARAVPAAERAQEQDANDCGSLSLFLLMRMCGREVGLKQIHERLNSSDPRGVTMRAIMDASRVLKFPLRAVRYGPHSLIREPALIHLSRGGRGHYAVVRPVGGSGTLLQMSDGFEEPRVLEMGKLYSSPYWNGLALVRSRSLAFSIKSGAFAALVFAVTFGYVGWRMRLRKWVSRTGQAGQT
jgi:ABC-type bacteriocin/lantibiotic exporter with double-glycine peptidase domain